MIDTSTTSHDMAFDTITPALYNEADIGRIAAAAAEQAVGKLLERIPSGTAKLDNSKILSQDISKGEDMSKEKRRVIVSWNDDGTPVIKQLTAANAFEMNDRIVREYVLNGRINEFIVDTKPATVTFGVYAQQWLDTFIVTRKPNTITTYRRILRALLPAFGSKNLENISAQDIQLYLNANKTLSRKTLRERLARLVQILDSAKEDGLIKTNPAKSKRLVIPTDKAEIREAIPLDVLRAVINEAQKLELKDRRFLMLLITTGVRRGEVLGLQWQDIDPEASVIHIRRNVTHAGGNAPIVGTPKTKSGVRDVPYDPAIRTLINPTGQQPNAFICAGASPTEPMTMTMYNNTWRRILKAIPALANYSAHSFRHTYATLLSEYTDATPKTIQAVAGHSDIRTTMAIYEHACPERITKATADMHALLFQ